MNPQANGGIERPPRIDQVDLVDAREQGVGLKLEDGLSSWGTYKVLIT